MPAPGDQHSKYGDRASPTNPFEPIKPRVSEYTAQEIATLQSRLQRKLGPEYISSRAGPSGQKVHYLAAEKCIQLANEVFGFNGWSSSIMQLDVDFVDENPHTFKVNLGLSVIVRVTLRDGTFHEDIGYGHIENCKGKAAAFEKAKKEGTTDAMKRALRNFGNVLGNCIYDKDYLSKVTKVKVQPTKWDVEGLHRHSDYASVKEPVSPVKQDPEAKTNSLGTEESIDDEFDDFDEADFSVAGDLESHPDEVVLPGHPTSRHFDHNNGNKSSSGPATNSTFGNCNISKGPLIRPNSMAAPAKPQNGPPVQLQQPQTPTNSMSNRSVIASGNGLTGHNAIVRQSLAAQSGPAKVAKLNQPSRTGHVSAPTSPGKQNRLNGEGQSNHSAAPSFPMGDGPGFFSARAAAMMPEPDNPEAPLPTLPATSNLPVFNPNAESPSIRKTPGIDHKKSMPVGRDGKHVPPGSTQSAASDISQLPNVINPHLNQARRLGAPASPSPVNRGGFKAPGPAKRQSDGGTVNRAPLSDLPSNIPADGGGDIKRQRVG